MVGITLYQIYKFSPVIKSCEDDFAVINKCGIVPCSWKDATTLNHGGSCHTIFALNITTQNGYGIGIVLSDP